jgi:3-(3-hydroxy-phenyl)propionate hydroxylase
MSSRLLDKVVGAEWRVFLDGRKIAVGDCVDLGREIEGLTVHSIVPAVGEAGEVSALKEKDGVLARWFDRHEAVGVIVRPDHYVFGAANDIAGLRQQLEDLRGRLA